LLLLLLLLTVVCFETFHTGTFPVILRHFPQSRGEYLQTVYFHSAPRSVHLAMCSAM
jgi:hypothetical protein